MAEKHSKRYALKHPTGTTPDPLIAEALKAAVKDQRISCAAAHRIAGKLDVSPETVGLNMDLLEYRINRCQMGLFGYYPEKRIIHPAEMVSPMLAESLRSKAREGRISCAEAWKIAAENDLSKLEVGSACEGLNLKIIPCQLGAF
jgi:hypothetical protein